MFAGIPVPIINCPGIRPVALLTTTLLEPTVPPELIVGLDTREKVLVNENRLAPPPAPLDPVIELALMLTEILIVCVCPVAATSVLYGKPLVPLAVLELLVDKQD